MLATHHVEATLRAPGGAVVRIDARVPAGYRIVLRDPRRYLDGGLAFELVKGTGRQGVLRFAADAGNTRSTPIDPAHPSPGASPRQVALAQTGLGRARRIAPGRYLLVRDGHPVGLVVRIDGPLRATVLGIGWGRTVLYDLARTLTARWLAPEPVANASDPSALALRDAVDAAILARDEYTVETRDFTGVVQSSTDVVRSAGYQATYDGGLRTAHPLVRIGPVLYRFDDGNDAQCWRTTSSRAYGPVRAPLLPVDAIGLRYVAPRERGGTTRLTYSYWDTVLRHETVSIDIDDATHLPATRRTDVPYDDAYSWTWQPVTRAATPAPVCS